MKQTFFIMIMAVVLTSCGTKKPKIADVLKDNNSHVVELTPEQMRTSELTYAKPIQKNLSTSLRLSGKIDVPPQNMVSISAPMGGYLKSTNMLPGMHIRKGDILAVMEDQQYIQLQQDYLLTKNKLAYSRLEYDRQKELNQSKASSDKVFQQAASDRNTLQITLNALGERLKLIGIKPAGISSGNISRSIRIYAPIDGFVSKVNVNIGKYVSPTDVLFELVNPNDIHLALKVFEKDLDKLFIGQKLVAYTNNQPDKKYACEIILIGKDLSADRNTDVHCHFESYDKSLIPGTYMNADVQVKTTTSFVLPEEAIVRFENKQYAFVPRAERQFEMVEVRTGTIDHGDVEIVDGEKFTSQTFVVHGAYTLLMALKNKSEDE